MTGTANCSPTRRAIRSIASIAAAVAAGRFEADDYGPFSTMARVFSNFMDALLTSHPMGGGRSATHRDGRYDKATSPV
jgi:hypothetical protein